jgi:hypothetical protein
MKTVPSGAMVGEEKEQLPVSTDQTSWPSLRIA